jgi:APA family basic amino acid/polyamine antiporter
MQRTLTLTDLTLFGIASIMGAGGFNLIGNGVRSGGAQWPIALAMTTALLLGSAWTYASAYARNKSNTSESDIIRTVLGVSAEHAESVAIIVYNIARMMVLLILIVSLILPEGGWGSQVMLSVSLLAAMTGMALMGIEANKTIVTTLSFCLVAVLAVAGGFGLMRPPVPTTLPTAPDFRRSLCMFFFVLVGFDAIIKFSEEAKEPTDIPTSFYLSTWISALLTLGVGVAIASWVRLTPANEGTAFESLFAVFMGAWIHGYFRWAVIAFLLLTTFVVFLATSRYLIGLGKKGGVYTPFATQEGAILSVFGLSAVTALINQVDALVIVTDFGFSMIGGLVAAATCVADWRDGLVGSALVDGATAAGFGAMMLAVI